jgi:hypothetical protein
MEHVKREIYFSYYALIFTYGTTGFKTLTLWGCQANFNFGINGLEIC